MGLIVEDLLVCYLHLDTFSKGVASVEVAIEAREVAAGDVYPNTMTP